MGEIVPPDSEAERRRWRREVPGGRKGPPEPEGWEGPYAGVFLAMCFLLVLCAIGVLEFL